MSFTKADHHDADIVLKIYDLRREARMRQSRDELNMHFWPKSYEEFFAITQMDHPYNQAFRQVTTYWEMVYGFAKNEVLNPDFLVDSNGEGLFFFAKVFPYLERFRKEYSPTAFQNTEWISTKCDAGRRRFEMVRQRVAQLIEKKQ